MRTWKRLITMLAVAPMVSLAFSTGVAHATACKVVTNPADSGIQFTRQGYNLEASVPFTTGDASSGCSDINVRYYYQVVGNTPVSGECLAQYKSGGTWHDDSAGLVYVTFNSSTLTVIGSGYANNVTVRIACLTGPQPTWGYPTYQALV